MSSSGGGGPCFCLTSCTGRSAHYLYSVFGREEGNMTTVFSGAALCTRPSRLCVAFSVQRSQKTTKVLERGFKYPNPLGRDEAKRQRGRCLPSGVQGWWLVLQPTACSRSRQDKKQ